MENQGSIHFIGDSQQPTGMTVSPGGFEFGVQGWNWGQPVPKSITFFLDGTAMVCDQWGRPMKGIRDLTTGKEILFARTPPDGTRGGDIVPRPHLATHAQVVEALEKERIDWQQLTRAGWPQLPYEQLKTLKELPSGQTLEDDLTRIKNSTLRKAALRMKREMDEAATRELEDVESD